MPYTYELGRHCTIHWELKVYDSYMVHGCVYELEFFGENVLSQNG